MTIEQLLKQIREQLKELNKNKQCSCPRCWTLQWQYIPYQHDTITVGDTTGHTECK